MKLPFMIIRQKEETFLLTKFKATDLLSHITFHFRQAYSDDNSKDVSIEEYLQKIRNKGIEIQTSEEGIQRRLQINKINDITKYLNNDKEESFFPNAVILSTNISIYNDSIEQSFDDKIIEQISKCEERGFGEIDLPDDIKFTIVDGQHRLAGLFLANDDVQKNFDIPAILLVNITVNTCAKIFSDVNGTQSTVNKSVIYDLYELRADSKLIEYKKKLHSICKNFNTDRESPLYRHIKMLGIGEGAISQSFFVNAVDKAIKAIQIDNNSLQDLYDNLFYYFRAFQRVFFDQWPVLENYTEYEEFRNYSLKIMKVDKSQILKTNGFGGIMKAFPTIYDYLKRNGELSYNAYHNIIERLKGEIDWCKDFTEGTGAKNQDKVKERILGILGLKDINKKDASKTGV